MRAAFVLRETRAVSTDGGFHAGRRSLVRDHFAGAPPEIRLAAFGASILKIKMKSQRANFFGNWFHFAV